MIIFFILPFLFLTASCAETSSVSEELCAELMINQCVSCHHSSRICQQLGKKSRSGWEKSIDNMIRLGARLSKEEKTMAIDCLFSAQPGAAFVCKN